jgi:hypothetical protein
MKTTALLVCLCLLCGCRPEDDPAAKPIDNHPCRPHLLWGMEAYCAGTLETPGPCAVAPKEYAVPCADGCVLRVCGPEITCKESPSACEGSCDELDSPAFWGGLISARNTCGNGGNDEVYVARPPSRECVIAETEKACPALAGKRWTEQVPDFAMDR